MKNRKIICLLMVASLLLPYNQATVNSGKNLVYGDVFEAKEKSTSEEITSEEITSEELTSEELTSEELTSEEITSEEITTEETTTVIVGDTSVDTVERKRTSKKVKIKLTKVADATSYDVEIATDPGFADVIYSKKIAVKDSQVINVTLSSKKFKNKGVLYVRARACINETAGDWTEGVRVKLIKKALSLIKYVKKKIGTPYLYGYKQPYEWDSVCTKKQFKKLRKRWGAAVWLSDKYRCVGKTPTDCSGLISAYIEDERGSIHYKEQAVKKWKIRKKSGRLNIAKLKRIPIGTAVWQEGHIGVFVGWIGNVPYYVAEDGSAYGCRMRALTFSQFTHALILPDVQYSIKKNYDVTVKSNTKFYKSATTSKRTYPWYKKGTKLTIVAEKNGRGLVRDYSLKQNLWVNLNTVKKNK